MASANLRQELICSICLNTYKDPVNLSCGHNFCRVCISHALNTQERYGHYFCPQCRKRFRSRPTLQRNITLRNIVQNFCSSQPNQEEIGIRCTYCIHSRVNAVKSCVLCEASLCNGHLEVHSKSPEHILADPTTSTEKRKCSIHKKILEYYCTADATYICTSCRLDGEHQGHKVETLDEASEKKKMELKNVLQKLITEREQTERRLQSLQERKGEVKDKAFFVTKRVTALLRRKLEDLEKTVLEEISRQENQLLLPLYIPIQQLEKKKDELSRKMGHIEMMCNMNDPLTVLQEPDTEDLCDTEVGDNEDTESHDALLHDGGDLDVFVITQTLLTVLSDMKKELNVSFNVQEAADILLDVNTAHNNLQISDDLKTVSWSDIKQNRPEKQERFHLFYQVLSSQSFSSGRHYWDVDVSKSKDFMVGMCYPSIERRGIESCVGRNEKSWGVERYNVGCSLYLIHDNKTIPFILNIPSDRVRICVDYEAGQLSFYDLCYPIIRLHTFTTTFTEPLHPVLSVWKGNIKICGKM